MAARAGPKHVEWDGIKLASRIPFEPTDRDFAFLAQLGVEHVYMWLLDHQVDLESLRTFRKRAEDFGLTLYHAGSEAVCKNAKFQLALPGRDEAIEEFATFIRNLAEVEIGLTTFTWEPAYVRTSHRRPTRGGAQARVVDIEELEKESPSHEGTYAESDLWENFEYFIERIIPVAEDAGVRLALHPNDPPVPSIGGIPCLVHNVDTHRRAFEICDSPNLGMEFCCGCWLEGGEAFGDIFAGIRHFVEQGKVFVVHFRNVESPLPHFAEAFIDDGYMDMYRLMKAFHDAGYRGPILPDHVPNMGFMVYEDDIVATAHALGYMKALLERAEAEGG